MSTQRQQVNEHSQTPNEITGAMRADEFDTSAATADAAVDKTETLAGGIGMLVVKRGPNAGSRFLLGQPVMSAGRHPASDIFLDDITVSRRHAEFRVEKGKFLVVDLGSLNKTYLNREPVDSAVLVHGDEIQLGNFRLVFITGPADPRN